jgi:putative ABC transport system permease protein
MIKNYFKIALRNFWRHKLFTLINVTGLSIGISAAVAIYLIVHFDLSFDKFHPDGDKIYRVVTNFSFNGEPGFNGGVTGPLGNVVKNEVTGLRASAPLYTDGGYKVTITNGDKITATFKNQNGIVYLDQRFFDIFPYKWLAGSPKTAFNEPHQLVLASRQAQKYFPHLSYAQMMGRRVVYEDTISTVVTGVIQEPVQNTDFTFNDFISFATIKVVGSVNSEMKDWGGVTSASQLFVKVSEGTKIKNVERQLDQLLKKYNPPKPEDSGSKSWFTLQPLSDLHFNEKYYSYENGVVSKPTLYYLSAIALVLLLLACINFINLTTAQGGQRAKEIGVRKTMGSTRKQLVIQFLSETFIVTLLAVIISVSASPFILKLFADFIPAGVKADLLHQPDLFLFLIALIIVVSGLSGFYPAVVLSGYKPVLVLKNQAVSNKSKTRNAWLRKSLTITQFVIAQFFIIATLIVSKQIYYATHKDLGFKKDAIISIGTPWKAKDQNLKQVLLNKIKAIPQVEMVSLGSEPPSSNGWSSRDITYKDGKKEIKAEVQMKRGDENYMKLYHIKLLAGRYLTMADTATSLIINAHYAQVLGFNTPLAAIGAVIPYSEKQSRQVVGVMTDFHQGSLHAAIKPMMFFTENVRNLGTVHIALRPETPGGGEWKKALTSMHAAWTQVYPNDDFEYHFFDETIAKFYDSEQHTSTLLTWAMGLSIFISCLGLLGLAIYTTNQRTKEIGVRKVLGASVAQIVTLLSTEMVLLIVIAFAIVCPLAWFAMNQWMESFADRTTISWWIFALSAAGMLLAAVITSSFETIKAAVANPVKSLRSE